MRGRKPLPLRIVPHDAPILAADRPESVPPLVSGPAGSHRPGRRRRGTDPTTGLPDAMRPARPSGGPAAATRARACPASWHRRNDPGDPPGFPPLQRAQIVQLACLEPIARGCTSPTGPARTWPARPSRTASSRPSATGRSARSCNEVDLQPHRTRYWKTARLDAEFKQRAEKILWCYANADRLARRGYWVVCVDEKPNCQVLERHPIRRSIPGSIEQREFEYTRHGTVNILAFLIVHSGRMEAACIEAKDARALHRGAGEVPAAPSPSAGAYLIHDGDPSHTAAATEDYLVGCGVGGGVDSRRSMPRGSTRRSCCSMRSATATSSGGRGVAGQGNQETLHQAVIDAIEEQSQNDFAGVKRVAIRPGRRAMGVTRCAATFRCRCRHSLPGLWNCGAG